MHGTHFKNHCYEGSLLKIVLFPLSVWVTQAFYHVWKILNLSLLTASKILHFCLGVGIIELRERRKIQYISMKGKEKADMRDNIFWGERMSITALESFQFSPVRPSGRTSMKGYTLER
jgi:hypothetical protein